MYICITLSWSDNAKYEKFHSDLRESILRLAVSSQRRHALDKRDSYKLQLRMSYSGSMHGEMYRIIYCDSTAPRWVNNI